VPGGGALLVRGAFWSAHAFAEPRWGPEGSWRY
jgi:hypothetical protein